MANKKRNMSELVAPEAPSKPAADGREQRFSGSVTVSGWIVAWSGTNGVHRQQLPRLRVRAGSNLEVSIETQSPYLVAEIVAETAFGERVHHAVLNVAEDEGSSGE